MDVVIRNGTIISASDTYSADLAIRDGKLIMIGQNLNIEAARVFDATGRFVLPGAIDAHVHLQMPVGRLVSADDCESGTRAAACGGVTTILDFATPDPGQPLDSAITERIALFEPAAQIDFGLHAVIRDTGDGLAGHMKKSIGLGVTSFKVYMVYAGLMVDDSGLARILALARDLGALTCVHAEDPSLLESRTRALLAAGQTSPWHHYDSRPELVEAEAIRRIIGLAKATKSSLYIVHLACREGLAAVAEARAEGYPVYAETCPQYLHFTHEVYKHSDGQRYVCSPAFKGQDSQDALWQGIARGEIDTVATDHCPFQSAEKDIGRNDFTRIPNGCMGVETLYPFMLSAANQGRISYNKAVEVCSTNVARLFGCAPQKGTIAIGSDADLVIYDPRGESVVSRARMHSRVDYTIWEGMRLAGRLDQVFSRGRLVYSDGIFTGEPGWGRFVRCR